MKKNMGTLDRTIRFIIAISLVVLYAFDIISGTLGIVLIVLSTVFLITSFIGFCPLYAPFKFNSLNTKKR